VQSALSLRRDRGDWDLIQVISPLAFILVLAHALIQFRRMLNEERVLQATFAEYEHYAAQTHRLIPFR